MKEFSKDEIVEITNRINKMQKATREFKQKNGREPNTQELAGLMQTTVGKVDEIKDILKELEEKDKKIELELEEKLVIDEDLKAKVKENLNILNEKEKEVLSLRMGFIDEKEYTVDEIALKLNISKKRARQIVAKGIRIARHPEKRKQLENIRNSFKA